jgi:hypothetical protein
MDENMSFSSFRTSHGWNKTSTQYYRFNFSRRDLTVDVLGPAKLRSIVDVAWSGLENKKAKQRQCFLLIDTPKHTNPHNLNDRPEKSSSSSPLWMDQRWA